ncbi:MAG: aminotransferase class I/II-fold pyridoxal phosphate-dependent enzyme, partial [Proteobacteria bacterium]|nr:aminotransferase class I/II-fold pyridoxal phosphate-dependent enzyme [Pseudomonadota bacterium]
IAVESLYSMDGDRAPLPALAALAQRHEAFLFIDEAHATGVFGPGGRGLAAELEGRDNIIVLHTCGKALGGAGALVTAPRLLADFLVNRARAFIFATAPSPLLAVAAAESLRILHEEPERRELLNRRVAHAAAGLVRVAPGIRLSGSQIQPIIIGDDAAAMRLAARLQRRGFDIRAVRPPTVPAGTARLRLSITLNATERDIDTLVETLAAESQELPA